MKRKSISTMRSIARSARSPYFEFMARLTEAYLYFHNGEESEGLRAHRAMELGRVGGYVNSFVSATTGDGEALVLGSRSRH